MTGDISTLQLDLRAEPSLYRDGQALVLPASRKTRALLVYLALSRRPHRRVALCELLFSRTDDPRAALRWSLTRLRALLGDALLTSRDTVQLCDGSAGVELDLAQLRHLLAEDAPHRLQLLHEFESSMDGDYLPGIDVSSAPEFELWLESERAELRGLHGQLLAQLQRLSINDPAAALHYARKRLLLNVTDIPASLDVLALLLEQEGLEPARQAFEQCRQRLQSARIDDSALLRGWHALSRARPATSPIAEPLPAPGQAVENVLQVPGRPSLAVLPFLDIGAAPDDVLGRGLTADLISRLSRLGGLFVIARASSTRFVEGEHSHVEIGQLLGVRYLIQGTIQRLQKRLRLTVELIDATQSRAVWVETFEHSRDDLFLLQDELANAIVSAVEPAIERAEYELARLKPPANLNAWENYHMALWHSFRFTSADTETARFYLRRALKLDPQFSRAHAALSLTHFSRAFLDSGHNIDKEIQRALESAEHSVGLDPRDAMGHWSLGRAQFLHKQHDLALVSLDRALVTNPNYAQGHYARGFVSVHSGIATEAIPELEIAQRLSPFDPLLFAIISSRALSLAMQDKYEEAADCAVRATLEANAHFHIHAVAAACLQLADRPGEARRHAGVVLKRHPGYSRAIFFRSFPYKYPEQQQRMSSALKNAGLP